MRSIPSAPRVVIIGAGLVGTTLALVLARQGCDVDVYEQHPDPRIHHHANRRAINLTLCLRGLTALAGVGISESLRSLLTPVRGRVLHWDGQHLVSLPYGPSGEALFAIQRNQLCSVLLDEAERHGRIRIHFEHRCTGLDLRELRIELTHTRSAKRMHRGEAMIIGADGAFSTIRLQLQQQYNFNYSQEYSSSAYVELPIVPGTSGGWTSHNDRLHVWPRRSSMLLAIPNSDGTFTGTLLLPKRGPSSHESIRTDADLLGFMSERFLDAMPHIPQLTRRYFAMRPIPLVTISCNPWSYQDRVLLVGDAAHAVFPSYGQGANAGFEDCRVLGECFVSCKGDWQKICPEFEARRRPHTDVIANLSKKHLADLQDAMSREQFVLRTRLETRLNEIFGAGYRSLYGMVSFTNIPYAEALQLDTSRQGLIDELLSLAPVREALGEPATQPLIESVARKYRVIVAEDS